MVRVYEMTFVVFVIQLLRIRATLSDLEQQSAQELRDNKKALMKSLGLLNVPRRIPIQSHLLRRYSAPKFMMGLFKEISYDKNRTDEHYEIERKYLDENKVDTVISFFKYDHDKSWNRIHEEFKLKFKTKFNPQEDIVQGGEMKIYKRLPRNSSMTHANCSMSVYLILPEGGNQLLDKLDVHAWESGWQTFNVTAAIKLWALFPLTNHGLKIVVNHAYEELSPHSFGLVSTRGNLEKRPYLVGFVKTTRVFSTFTPQLVVPSRERRAAQAKWKSSGKCRLKEYYVNFKALGLYNTIIAPLSYNMYFCQGLCSYPFDSDTTNHAVLQSLYNVFDSTAAPEPCCVPKNLKPINLLFYNDDGNIELKNHPDMIATSCHCY